MVKSQQIKEREDEKIVKVKIMKKNFLATINTMKDRISKVVFGALVAVNLVMHNTMTAYATQTPAPTGGNTTGGNTTGVGNIDFGIGKLISLFTGIVSAYGIILLIRNGVEFFSALQDRDSSTMKQAGLGMLSGFGIASIGGVITFLGFTW